MKIKALIIDDELSARSRLRKLLNGHPEVEIIGEAGDGLQAVSRIEELRPDLIFLDVQMPGLSGIEVLRSLPQPDSMPLVIFTTAYDEYAMAAFDANAVGYLLKPISRERLDQAIERARKLAVSESLADGERKRIQRAVSDAAGTLTQLVGRRRDRFVLIRLDKIFLIRVEDGLVKFRTEEETYWTDYQLNDLEARLPYPPFFRVHRSVIVNMRKVKEIVPLFKGSYLLIMNDRESSEVPVSERQSKKLREKFLR